jgi:ribulose-5-phosphate 4-epimerase/fuculose-1-phosphate aldolase
VTDATAGTLVTQLSHMDVPEYGHAMDREGVIHFEAAHVDAALPNEANDALPALFAWRALMKQLGFIGLDPARYDGVGFGNVSVRIPPFRGPRGQDSAFLITATQTGALSTLNADNVVVVDDWDLRKNRVRSRGRALASSESLTHGAVYDVVPHARAVIHVHAPAIFAKAAALSLPSTRPGIGYGTVAMAEEVARLWRDTDLADLRVFAMTGHEDGVISFGQDLDDAGARLTSVYARALTA